MTVSRLASRMGVSQGHLSNALAGKRQLSTHCFDMMMLCLGLSAEDLARELAEIAENLRRVQRIETDQIHLAEAKADSQRLRKWNGRHPWQGAASKPADRAKAA